MKKMWSFVFMPSRRSLSRGIFSFLTIFLWAMLLSCQGKGPEKSDMREASSGGSPEAPSAAPSAVRGLSPLGSNKTQDALVGYPAPSLTATDRNGGRIDLHKYRGRVVVLNFWATWCPPCLEELPSLERLRRQLNDVPVDIIGISVDEGWDEIDKVLEKQQVSFVLGLNPDREDPARYGTVKFPETFIIDPEGKVVQKLVGAQIWDRGDYVERLRELAAP